MDAWEGLDVDDADLSLPALAPPSKRPFELLERENSLPRDHIARGNDQSTPVGGRAPTLRPCSIHAHSPSLTDNPQTGKSSLRQSPSRAVTKHRIPGPAGAVQASMHRQVTIHQDHSRGAVLSSPESNDIYDEDFRKGPWLCALSFLGEENFQRLRSVKNNQAVHRVSMVVGVIKSCKLNGLGNAMIILKDPSGTIAGTVHRNVFSDSMFSSAITVDSAIVLQQVAVFRTARTAYYLNIMLNNIVKVFSRESIPSERSAVFQSRILGNGATMDRIPVIAGKLSVRIDQTQEFEAIKITNEASTSDMFVRQPKCSQISDCALKEAASSQKSMHDLGGRGSMQMVSKLSHAQWTEEQVAELFAGIDEF